MLSFFSFEIVEEQSGHMPSSSDKHLEVGNFLSGPFCDHFERIQIVLFDLAQEIKVIEEPLNPLFSKQTRLLIF